MALIDFDKFLASFITEMRECSQMRNFSIPRCIKKALVDQGLDYKGGEIIKTQCRVSAEAKENGYGESEDEIIRKHLIDCVTRTIPEADAFKEISKEQILDWLEKQGSEPNWCHHKVDLSNCSEEYRKAYYDGWNNCNQQHSQCESEKSDVLKCLINGMKFYYEDNEEATWGTEKFSMKVKDILSWLEKQGKQKSIDDLTQQEAMDIAVAKCFEQDEPQVYEIEDGKVITYSETGGYKVVEPKFKVGDWIVTDKNHIWLIDEDCSTTGYSYRLISQNGKVEVGDYNIVDEHARLWTIQDAKDGDVLATDSWLYIFKYTNNKALIQFHCTCPINGRPYKWCFSSDSDDSYLDIYVDANIHPATKEQRDTLFAKMEESGYKWNAEKKELKKIDNEEVNGEDYGIDGLYQAQRILEKTLGSVDGYQTDDGILSHKCAITAIKKLYKQKAKEWSDEDERMFDYALDMIEWYSGKNGDKSKLVSDWLKSLKDKIQSKPQWKPNSEQLYTLHWLATNVLGDGVVDKKASEILYTLYDDLKKLKG